MPHHQVRTPGQTVTLPVRDALAQLPVRERTAAADSCSYASGDGRTLLTLAPSIRSYAAEASASHSLVSDPASAGMRDVKVSEVTGLGQGAFSETTQVLQPQQNVAYVV